MTTTQQSPRLRARSLVKDYPGTAALAGVSMTVAAGESVAIMGPSGSGKTTLMHVLSGIVSPDEGRVLLADPRSGTMTDVAALGAEQRTRLRRERIGFVFQEGLLLPELTALENVAFALMLAGAPRGHAEEIAVRNLAAMGLAGLEHRRPGQLSGGQAQRVAIARAQALGPEIVFADEPTGALDTVTSGQVLTALMDSTTDRGASLVVVTHDSGVARACDRTIRLRDGRIVEDGTGVTDAPGSWSPRPEGGPA